MCKCVSVRVCLCLSVNIIGFVFVSVRVCGLIKKGLLARTKKVILLKLLLILISSFDYHPYLRGSDMVSMSKQMKEDAKK